MNIININGILVCFFPFESTLIILKFCFGLLDSFVSFDLFMEVKSMVVKRAPSWRLKCHQMK